MGFDTIDRVTYGKEVGGAGSVGFVLGIFVGSEKGEGKTDESKSVILK